MKVKWNGGTIDIPNQSTKKNEFYCNWNYYTILITKEKLRSFTKDYGYGWYIQLTNPTGGYDYDGYFKNSNDTYKGTISQALQDCFNNIDYPLMSVSDEEDK